MPLSRDLRGPAPASATPDGAGREKLISCIALSWGLCAYFPVGVTYLHLFMMLFALAFSPQARQRMRDLRRDDLLLPLVLLLAWTLLATAVGDWYPDTGTRLFHIFRVALVLCMALALNAAQARAAIRGLLLGSVAAAAIVAAHQVWGLPDWAIWRSLLASRNNFSSGNMITMAMASGLSFFLGIAADTTPRRRWLALATALVLAATVALHAVSRNAQLLLVLLLLTALVCRFRSLRAALGGLVSVLLLVVVVWQFSPTTQSRFAEMSSQLQAVQTESPSKYGTSVVCAGACTRRRCKAWRTTRYLAPAWAVGCRGGNGCGHRCSSSFPPISRPGLPRSTTRTTTSCSAAWKPVSRACCFWPGWWGGSCAVAGSNARRQAASPW